MDIGNQIRDDKIYSQHNRSTSNGLANAINSSNSNNNCSSSSNPKMGSRRIFTPQFKLQVLESYRSDSDCKGNQRATARKYNIHRRQIQKWLQCESSLRSSVANLNSEKQQFHNINMAQPHHENHREITRPRSSASPINMAFAVPQQLPLESGMPGLALHSKLHALPSRKTSSTNSVHNAHKIFTVPNFTAGTLDIGLAAASSSISTPCATPLKSTVAVLHPGKMVNTNRSSAGIIVPPNNLLPHHYHEHHYGIPSCSHTAAGLQVSVPILSHPFAHHHHHMQPHILHDPKRNHHYQYQSLPHRTQIITHQVSPHLTPLFSRSSPITTFTTSTVSKSSERNAHDQVQQNSMIKEILQPIDNQTLSIAARVPNKKHRITLDEDNNSNYAIASPSSSQVTSSPMYQYNKDKMYSASGFSVCPMDLSLGNRHDKNRMHDIKPNVVDLTFKKRKILPTNDGEKFPKISAELYNDVTPTSDHCISNKDSDETVKVTPHEDEIDVEIEVEDKTPPPSPQPKPVKLFKPYLLDDENDKGKVSTKTNSNATSIAYQSSNVYENATECTAGNNFQSQTSLYNINPTGSPNFLTRPKTASPISAFSPTTSLPTLSPSTLQGCKDSPMSSGYESSSSSHSDTASYRADPANDAFIYGRTSYSVNLHMHQIYTNDNIMIPPTNHIHNWLDQDNTNLTATNSSIALYA